MSCPHCFSKTLTHIMVKGPCVCQCGFILHVNGITWQCNRRVVFSEALLINLQIHFPLNDVELGK